MVALQQTLARNVRLSAMSLILSPSSSASPDFFPSSGLMFSEIPSRLSLFLDSVTEASSCTPLGEETVSSLISDSSPSFSSSTISFPSSTCVLGAATTVVGSAVSSALSKTYTVHHGS